MAIEDIKPTEGPHDSPFVVDVGDVVRLSTVPALSMKDLSVLHKAATPAEYYGYVARRIDIAYIVCAAQVDLPRQIPGLAGSDRQYSFDESRFPFTRLAALCEYTIREDLGLATPYEVKDVMPSNPYIEDLKALILSKVDKAYEKEEEKELDIEDIRSHSAGHMQLVHYKGQWALKLPGQRFFPYGKLHTDAEDSHEDDDSTPPIYLVVTDQQEAHEITDAVVKNEDWFAYYYLRAVKGEAISALRRLQKDVDTWAYTKKQTLDTYIDLVEGPIRDRGMAFMAAMCVVHPAWLRIEQPGSPYSGSVTEYYHVSYQPDRDLFIVSWEDLSDDMLAQTYSMAVRWNRKTFRLEVDGSMTQDREYYAGIAARVFDFGLLDREVVYAGGIDIENNDQRSKLLEEVDALPHFLARLNAMRPDHPHYSVHFLDTYPFDDMAEEFDLVGPLPADHVIYHN